MRETRQRPGSSIISHQSSVIVWRGLVAAGLVLAVAGPASANPITPILGGSIPATLKLLGVVVVVEALVYSRLLRASAYGCVMVSAVSNLASTMAGYALASVMLFGIAVLAMGSFLGPSLADRFSSLSLSRAWSIPFDPSFRVIWAGAALIGMVPAFYLSVFIERCYALSRWRTLDRAQVLRAVWKANLVSYGLLFLVAVVMLSSTVWTVWWAEFWGRSPR